MTDQQTFFLNNNSISGGAYLVAANPNILPLKESKLIVHSSRPPLAKRGTVQYNHVQKPINLKQFDCFFSKNAEEIRNDKRMGLGERSTILA